MLGWLSQSTKEDQIFGAMPEVAGTKPSELFAALAQAAPTDRPLIYAYQGGDIKECGASTPTEEMIRKYKKELARKALGAVVGSLVPGPLGTLAGKVLS